VTEFEKSSTGLKNQLAECLTGHQTGRSVSRMTSKMDRCYTRFGSVPSHGPDYYHDC